MANNRDPTQKTADTKMILPVLKLLLLPLSLHPRNYPEHIATISVSSTKMYPTR
jgi:hypothetical protein